MAAGSAAVLGACGGSGAAASPALKTFGGTLPTPTPRATGERLTIVSYPVSSFDPDPLKAPAADPHLMLLYTPLVGVKPTEAEVDLRFGMAEKIDTSDDGKTLTLKVRPNVKFHNNEPVTARDVAFSIERSASILAGRLAGVEQTDAATVVMHLNSPSATLLTEISPLVEPIFIVPADYYERVGPEGFAAKPVGSGPFEWMSGERDRYVDLHARPLAHQLLGRPRFRIIHFEKIKEPGIRANMLRSGQAEIAELHRDALSGLEQMNFTVQTKPAQRVIGLYFPQAADSSAPAGNASLRNAVSMAIDRDTLARTLLAQRGVSTWGAGWPPPADLAASAPQYQQAAAAPDPYDPAQARKLLADAGLAPDQLKLEVVATSQFPEQPQLAEAVRQMLGAIGIQATITPIDLAGWNPRTAGKNQLTLLATDNSQVGLGPARALLHSGGAMSVAANPNLDRLIDAAAQAADIEEYRRLFGQAAGLARQNAYLPGLFAMDAIWGSTFHLPLWGLEQSRTRSGTAIQKLVLDTPA
jgi:peptide/nickel transport system substrate-binding protein